MLNRRVTGKPWKTSWETGWQCLHPQETRAHAIILRVGNWNESEATAFTVSRAHRSSKHQVRRYLLVFHPSSEVQRRVESMHKSIEAVLTDCSDTLLYLSVHLVGLAKEPLHHVSIALRFIGVLRCKTQYSFITMKQRVNIETDTKNFIQVQP